MNKFTVYGGINPFNTNSLEAAIAEGERLAQFGVTTECRDADFNHVFTMGER